MNVWVVRAGRDGENEELDLDKSIVTIGWSELGDLTEVHDREQLQALMRDHHPDASNPRLGNWTGQVWSFCRLIAIGDMVLLPLKRRSAIAMGKVTGEYRYEKQYAAQDACNTRPVTWIRTDVPRASIDQDLLFSIGAIMTVFQVKRNNASARLSAVMAGNPGAASASKEPSTGGGEVSAQAAQEELVAFDFERNARDAISKTIGRQFKGHDLERLVEAVLVAEGYQVDRTRRGADGGVDLLAGRGGLGFDSPRICVQVKSSDYPEDVKTIRELQGALKTFGAEQGLLVSWGGFKPTVYAEGRRAFFHVRLWNADDLVEAILESYDRLGADIRAELPLKRVWVPVQDVE